MQYDDWSSFAFRIELIFARFIPSRLPTAYFSSSPASSCLSSELVLHTQEAERAQLRARVEEAAAHSPLVSRLLQYPSASPGISFQSGSGSASTLPGLYREPSAISRLACGYTALVERSVAGESVTKDGVISGLKAGEIEVHAAPPDGVSDHAEAMDEPRERLTQRTSLPL